MWKNVLFFFMFIMISSCNDDKNFDGGCIMWKWLDTGILETAAKRLIYEEQFGEGNSIRLNQSMAIHDGKVFCFNDGQECRVYDMETKQKFKSNELPDYSHHNNAQFLKTYYKETDKYPLLLLSRGNYPPSQNELFVVRVTEENQTFSFEIVKTIHNSINEAKFNGSWVADEDHGTLFLYCMTTGDWRKKEDNVFCIFSFPLPDVTNTDNVDIGYEDVLDKWVYSYLIHQGGTCYNGFLFFNIQDLNSINGHLLSSYKNVLAINADNGHVEAFLPLEDNKETEGISVYNNKLYVSFKDGNSEQQPYNTVFSLYEYSLPSMIAK